ncbi:MAG TPA: PIG-L family deacetylase [Tepidisphaeraceae bacterium]|nr:PIG-L family deacetylase [Tepidisphaeraceae bacterium]
MTAGALRADSIAPQVVLQELRAFDQMGSVLYVAAHPDDENTQLIAYFARGRNYRMAYLSLTRGDGGQNVLGPEFGPELGVLRTEELLAARRIDGGRQYFTRALDFGFSKDYRSTLKIWDKQQVLSDMVRVIREFRPDIIITRFTTVPGNTHGHHTASAILALEAFKLAGDPKAFPDQLTDLQVWQPRRIFSNGFAVGLGRNTSGAKVVRLSDSGIDPVSGLSFADLAGRSRSMHKTQGFGNFVGGGGRGGQRAEAFQLMAGDPPTKDVMDGIDTTWSRVGAADVGKSADDLIAQFDSQDLSANVPALLAIKKRVAELPADPLVDEKRELLDQILQQCLGLEVQTTLPSAEFVPGETMAMRHQVAIHSAIPVQWLKVEYPSIGGELSTNFRLTADQPAKADSSQTLPASTPISQPYWLREPETAGMFVVDDPKLIGRPENPPVFPVDYVFDVAGQTLIVHDQPTAAGRRLEVIPPVSLKFASNVQLFAPRSQRSVTITVSAQRPDSSGRLRLIVPDGWQATPDSQPFDLAAVGDHADLQFNMTAPAQPDRAVITADAEVRGAHYNNERIELKYSHLPFILLQPAARLKAVALDLAVRGKIVGYIPGAGDDTEAALKQMGYSVVELTGADLTPQKLHDLDAVVIGIRAFNVRNDLSDNLPFLFNYIQNGGVVIVQYNRPDREKTIGIAPYDLQLSQDRVTDPSAAMTILAPDHPAMNVPNKITQSDFAGWVQERGTYFPNDWDSHFVPLLACSDAGEAPLKGSLLIAQYGKGYYVYTGLTFFRQLPGGVPGAYRLFANLIALGK